MSRLLEATKQKWLNDARQLATKWIVVCLSFTAPAWEIRRKSKSRVLFYWTETQKPVTWTTAVWLHWEERIYPPPAPFIRQLLSNVELSALVTLLSLLMFSLFHISNKMVSLAKVFDWKCKCKKILFQKETFASSLCYIFI